MRDRIQRLAGLNELSDDRETDWCWQGRFASDGLGRSGCRRNDELRKARRSGTSKIKTTRNDAVSSNLHVRRQSCGNSRRGSQKWVGDGSPVAGLLFDGVGLLRIAWGWHHTFNRDQGRSIAELGQAHQRNVAEADSNGRQSWRPD
jgi:hypothetical protein